MRNFKWLERQPTGVIHTLPGDKIIAHITDADGVQLARLEHELTEPRTVNEIGLFEAEVEGRNAIGCLFMDCKERSR